MPDLERETGSAALGMKREMELARPQLWQDESPSPMEVQPRPTLPCPSLSPLLPISPIRTCCLLLHLAQSPSLVPQPLLLVCGHLWAETQVLGPLHDPQLRFSIPSLYLGPKAASSSRLLAALEACNPRVESPPTAKSLLTQVLC